MKNKKLQEGLDSIDLYGGKANTFTIKGRTNLNSIFGVSFSLVHLLALIAFGSLKLTIVITKYNPDVSVFDEAEQHGTKEEGMNLDDINF